MLKFQSVSKLHSHSQSNRLAYHNSEIIIPSTHRHSYDLNLAIRRTPSLDQISIKQAHFLQKNAAPYKRKNTVIQKIF